MKHFTLLLATVMLIAFTGCSATVDKPQNVNSGDEKTGGQTSGTVSSVMDVLDDDMRAVFENRDSALPVAVIYTFQGEGGRMDSPLYGEAAVNETLNAIADIVIIAETDRCVTDSDSSYTFINADGTQAGSVSFNGGNLEVGDKKYEVDNKKVLAAIDFPAETLRDMLTLDGPDPLLAEFCDRIGSDKPVAVKMASDGSEYEITNADTISECISVLHTIGLTYAWEGASEPETTLIATFVMDDGTEYSVTFHDESVYVYEFPQPLGLWSYHADGAENFWKLFSQIAEDYYEQSQQENASSPESGS